MKKILLLNPPGKKLYIRDYYCSKISKMECPGCGAYSTELKYKKNGHIFFQCGYCGLLFVDPDRQDLNSSFYGKEYIAKRTLPEMGFKSNVVENFRKKTAQNLIDKIKKSQSKAGHLPLRLLDIGCGEGYFLEVAKLNNYEVYGLEVSGYAAELAKARINSPIFLGSLNEANFQNNYFDVVCLIDVIEHFKKPYEELREIKRILKKGGILCIQTPNVNCFYSKIMRLKWFQIKPQEHLFYFSDISLPILLKRLKFELDILKPTGIYVTPRFLVNVLSETNLFLSKVLGFIFKMLFIYDRVLYFSSGHILCIAVKVED